MKKIIALCFLPMFLAAAEKAPAEPTLKEMTEKAKELELKFEARHVVPAKKEIIALTAKIEKAKQTLSKMAKKSSQANSLESSIAGMEKELKANQLILDWLVNRKEFNKAYFSNNGVIASKLANIEPKLEEEYKSLTGKLMINPKDEEAMDKSETEAKKLKNKRAQ